MMNPQHLRNWQAAQTPKQRRLAARVIGSAIARPKTEHDKPPFVFIRRNPPILIDRENLPVRWADPRHYAHLISYLDLSGKMRYLTQDPPPGEPGSHARIPQPEDDQDAPTIYPVDRLAHPPLHYDDETPSHLQTLRWIQEQLRAHHIEVHLTSQHLAQLDHAIPAQAGTPGEPFPVPNPVIPAQAGTPSVIPAQAGTTPAQAGTPSVIPAQAGTDDYPEPPPRAEYLDTILGQTAIDALSLRSDPQRLRAIRGLGRLIGPQHTAELLLQLAFQTASEPTRTAALNSAARGLGAHQPPAPEPARQIITTLHFWEALNETPDDYNAPHGTVYDRLAQRQAERDLDPEYAGRAYPKSMPLPPELAERYPDGLPVNPDYAIPEDQDPVIPAQAGTDAPNPVIPAPDSVIPAQAGTHDHPINDPTTPAPPFPNSSLPPGRGEVRWGVQSTEHTAAPSPDDYPTTNPPFDHPDHFPAPDSVIPAQAGTDDHFPPDDHQPPYNPPGYLPPLHPLPGDPALNTLPTDDDITHDPFVDDPAIDDPVIPAPPSVIPAPNPVIPAQAGTATPAQAGTTTNHPDPVIPAPPSVIPAQAGTRPPQPNPPDLSLLHNQHPLPPHIIQRIRQRQRRRELEREYGPDYDLRLRPNLTVHIRR